METNVIIHIIGTVPFGVSSSKNTSENMIVVFVKKGRECAEIREKYEQCE